MGGIVSDIHGVLYRVGVLGDIIDERLVAEQRRHLVGAAVEFMLVVELHGDQCSVGLAVISRRWLA